jgi:WD40 repeat protein
MRRASYSPDDRLLALSSSDHGRVFIWELTSGQVTELPRAATGVFSTVFGPNQGLLACGHLDGTIRLWGIKTAATGVQASDQGVLEGHDQATVSLLFDSDGKTLLSAAFDGTLRIWDLVPTPDGVLGFRRAVLRGFAGPVVAMCFSPDQRTLLTSEAAPGPFPGVVKLWRLSTLEEVAARQRDDPKGR